MKRRLETVLVRSGLAAAGRRLRRGGRLILAYHNILPDRAVVDGDVSLHLPRDDYARQLDQLVRTHEVRPVDELLDGAGSSGRPMAAITFDDAYHGAVTLGVQEAVARELPATIFVAPGMLGRSSFWWDALASAQSGGLPDHVRQDALTAHRGADDQIRAWARRMGMPPREVDPAARPATEDELTAAATQPGITVASHSWSHPNLARLDPDQLEEELRTPFVWLRERFRSFRPWLAYPYGLSSRTVEEAARGAGYEIAVRVEGGWICRDRIDRFSLPRLNIPAGVSAPGFELRTAGFLCR
jgi:peptidoglycan/xylan/chitin deacetylase (PgdA/CDA1 family)